MAISAAAGSGKTSTLRMLARARPATRMLYVAYATNGAGGARSFRPEWCTPAWKDSSRSASGWVRVRQVPASARQARADWQARHRPGANRIEQELPTSPVSTLVLGS